MHRFDLDNVAVYPRYARARAVRLDLAGGESAGLRHGGSVCGRGAVPEYITIDIAHGHAESVQKMIAYLKAKTAAVLRHRRQRGHARGGD